MGEKIDNESNAPAYRAEEIVHPAIGATSQILESAE